MGKVSCQQPTGQGRIQTNGPVEKGKGGKKERKDKKRKKKGRGNSKSKDQKAWDLQETAGLAAIQIQLLDCNINGHNN